MLSSSLYLLSFGVEVLLHPLSPEVLPIDDLHLFYLSAQIDWSPQWSVICLILCIFLIKFLNWIIPSNIYIGIHSFWIMPLWSRMLYLKWFIMFRLISFWKTSPVALILMAVVMFEFHDSIIVYKDKIFKDAYQSLKLNINPLKIRWYFHRTITITSKIKSPSFHVSICYDHRVDCYSIQWQHHLRYNQRGRKAIEHK